MPAPDFDRRLLGALPYDDGVLFRVWAPRAQAVDLVLNGGSDADGRVVPLHPAGDGYFERTEAEAAPGTRYRYRLHPADAGAPRGPFPDPASRFQPDGVHGPSAVVDPLAFAWTDDGWDGVAQANLAIYELHVGTFTPEGTFDAARAKLPYLADLGVTAVELMPVHDFPGRRNWGYDPAALYAPSRAYGPPDALRAFVDAAHHHGLAVLLDVVYNHLGPDGAYGPAFMPVFTDRHETPWGQAVNLDDDGSDGVRHVILDNAAHWLREYHLDGLRLDATHALIDDRPTHVLEELAVMAGAQAEMQGRPMPHLFAEDERNCARLAMPREAGGYGLSGVWADDLHHLVRHQTAGDAEGYFADFAGTDAEDLARTLRQGWYYTGQHAAHYGGPRGTDPSPLRPEQFVICIQNHDQVGNRPQGRRLTDAIDLATFRAVTALLLVAPQVPLVFMGQEWAASTPFQYFTDHNDDLGPLVTEGRKEEFSDFPGFDGEVPDPQAEATFCRSTLDWDEAERPPHDATRRLYRTLLHLRRDLPDASSGSGAFDAQAHGAHALMLRRGPYRLFVSLRGEATFPLPGEAEVLLTTEDDAFAPDPQPVRVERDAVHVPRPGAVLVRPSA